MQKIFQKKSRLLLIKNIIKKLLQMKNLLKKELGVWLIYLIEILNIKRLILMIISQITFCQIKKNLKNGYYNGAPGRI
jgi:hypothetical protein